MRETQALFFFFYGLWKQDSGTEEYDSANQAESDDYVVDGVDSIFHACSIAHPQPNASFFFVFFTIVCKSLTLKDLRLRPRRARVTP